MCEGEGGANTNRKKMKRERIWYTIEKAEEWRETRFSFIQSNEQLQLLKKLFFCVPVPPTFTRPALEDDPPARISFCSILLLMSRASVKNASSMLRFAFAEVSRNFVPYSIASCSPRSLDTSRRSSMSHLFPIIIRSTSDAACSSMLRIQFLMFSNERSFVIS